MYFWYYGWLLIPAMIVAAYAQMKVKSNYKKYSKVRNTRGLTGAQVAEEILRSNGLYHVQVMKGKGNLTDHYNPKTETVTLSPHVYDAASISAASIAAHECGHAVQHASAYGPLAVRSLIAPTVGVVSKYAGMIAFGGILLSSFGYGMLWLLDVGIVLYLLITLFHLITLPVEFNASSRAIKMLTDYGFLYDEDIEGTKKVLNAAAMTYVAAMLTALLSTIRLILVRNSRR